MALALPRRAWTRRLAAFASVAVLVTAAACGASPSSAPAPEQRAASETPGASAPAPEAPTPTPSPTPEQLELPRGGTEIFPDYRLFGYSGAPDAPGQGRLGIGNLNKRVVEMEKRAKPYKGGREILPVMELIATTVHSTPGKDGMYRTRIEDKVVKQWLKTARKNEAILLLNIQPGRADFIDEVKAYEKWLKEPDVGLALDPEWAIGKGQVPGRVFGKTTGKELNGVAKWTADLVEENNLPEKVIVYHQLRADVVNKEGGLKEHEGVVLVKSIDGIGPPGAKVELYKRIMKDAPKFVSPGFKLFYEEDAEGASRLMTSKEVMALKPRPEYILFE